ncbi:hypothetical protein UFOVP172_8 [uncultured Caudovirales phage]|uniref:Uncharacterized protein n=1 Tax=uncultured Caudovirales phage TaxID=2100421 RepID=A0A6J7WAK1_9CAUD|nr:hypothetical protein UFOVP172_8 [uncultured Caudovirales phage]
MIYLLSDGRYIGQGTPFTFDGNQYPENWFALATQEDIDAIGAQLVTYTNEPANTCFYTVTEIVNGAQITYVNTPKDLFECQNQAVTALNATSWSILNPTDWMVTKAFETSTPVPPAWNAWREQIRLQASKQRNAITNCKTVDELAALPPVDWAHDPNYVAPAEPK